jgi:twitching motility two-component system response regulator PilH
MARILFIDDDPITLKMICRLAELQGHEALTAENGAAAIQSALDYLPDLILTDMMLPDMDGLEVIGSLRRQPSTSGIPIVVLTAGSELDAEEQVRAAGGQGYLIKPIGLDSLAKVIDDHGLS